MRDDESAGRCWAQRLIATALLLSGCAGPQAIEPGPLERAPALQADHVFMPDGYQLPLRVWSGSASPSILVLGLHGFNDYSHAIEPLGLDLAKQGIRTYAVDQRGFGATRLAGRWHGSERLVEDACILINLLHRRHPQAEIYIAGESMGGAVAMLASARCPSNIAGLILIAPAVWSRDSMPWYQRLALTAAVHTVPSMILTGKGIRIRPTDNRALLYAMSADPLIIKGARVDALWGVTELMDKARARTPSLKLPTLLLYGARDEIIPKPAFCGMIRELPNRNRTRLVLYRNGWHMLPRDRQGARVRADIVAWLLDPSGELPSGEETWLSESRLKTFCSKH
ncbi:alpha/beta hydrolase [Thiorhodococcus drewsii]|nr:alpha/beta hydrolase [Thiorhodococcus drewsii]